MSQLKQILPILLIILSFSIVYETNAEVKTESRILEFHSPDTQTSMIELYTSEGCSSCPPADSRLNSYVNDAQLWRSVIPLAFHVDYWDYIGWRDRFASPLHGKRQSRYAKLNRERTVYTPAFVVNGKNWRPGVIFNKSLKVNSARVGSLSLQINQKTLQASFSPVKNIESPLILNVAVLGMDLKSDIKRGENRGRQAQHHFVVLAWKQAHSKNQKWQTVLPTLSENTAPRYALVAWVSRQDHPAPIQATGGYIPYQLFE